MYRAPGPALLGSPQRNAWPPKREQRWGQTHPQTRSTRLDTCRGSAQQLFVTSTHDREIGWDMVGGRAARGRGGGRHVLSMAFLCLEWSRGHHQPCRADLHSHTHVRPRLHATALHAGYQCRILLRRIIAGMGPASAVVSGCRAACKATERESRWCPSHGLLLPSILGNPTVPSPASHCPTLVGPPPPPPPSPPSCAAGPC